MSNFRKTTSPPPPEKLSSDKSVGAEEGDVPIRTGQGTEGRGQFPGRVRVRGQKLTLSATGGKKKSGKASFSTNLLPIS